MKKRLRRLLTAALLLALLCFGGYELMNARDFQLFGKIVSRADTDQKRVALTFDDGPTDRTKDILAMLEKLDIRCTFFLTGKQIEENMEDAKAIAEAGHQIGNHTYSHERMIFKSLSFIENEIDKTNALIREAGYAGEIVFRPPYGKKLIFLPWALSQRGMTAVTWNVEPDSFPDIASDPQRIADYAVENAREGSIILLHVMNESNANSLEAVPDIAKRLKDKGFTFVTVSELLSQR